MAPRIRSGLAPPPVAIHMHIDFARLFDFLYGPFFKVTGFFYRTYSANRARVERLKANPRFAALLRGLTVLVLVGWILIWVLASEEDRTRLVGEVRQTIGLADPQAGQIDAEATRQ
jgi:hypothetical protein